MFHRQYEAVGHHFKLYPATFDMNKFREFIKRQQTWFLLNKVSKLIYSEKYLISTDDDREIFLTLIAGKNNKNKFLITCLAVQCVTRNISYQTFYEPFNKSAISEIFLEVNNIEKFSTSDDYTEALDLAIGYNRLKALRHLRLTSMYLVNGREAYKQSPNSFEGIRYIREKNNKRPLSIKEQQNCKKSADEIAELDKQVKETEERYQDAVSKLKAQAALDKIVQEVKEAQSNSGNPN